MQIRIFDLEQGTSEVVFRKGGRLRDVAVIDGDVYVLTNNRDGRGNPDQGDDHLLKIEWLTR